MKDALKFIEELGLLPVVTLEDTAKAVPLASALNKGEIPAVEITFRAPGAPEAIAAIRKAFPEMAIAAGTVLTLQQAEDAIRAGADFIVTPGFNPELVRACLGSHIAIVPGIADASQISQAVAMGLTTLKFFPAESLGGITMLSVLHDVFPQVRFLCTGGLDLDNLDGYLARPFVAAAGVAGWGAVAAKCSAALDISLGFRLAHVGVNSPSAAEALNTARAFARLLRLPMCNDAPSGVFNGGAIDNRKSMYYGKNGHIGFTACSMTRALAWYRRNNVPIIEKSLSYDGSGIPACFYLADEIAGFAIHFMQRH